MSASGRPDAVRRQGGGVVNARAELRAMPDVAGIEFPLADLDAFPRRPGRPESAHAAARVDAVARVSRPGHGNIFRRLVAAVALGVCAVVLWPSIRS